MKKVYDVLVMGGGLGGLLSSAYYSKLGYDVILVEKLPFLGGRFTDIVHDGVQVPTGAVHMIPHGQRGMLGQMLLKTLNLKLDIVDTDYLASWQWKDRKIYSHNNFWKIVGAAPKFRQKWTLVYRIAKDYRNTHKFIGVNFADYLSSVSDDPAIRKIFDALLGFALSLTSDQISTVDVFRVLHKHYHYGRPGIPVGGCSNIVKQLEKILLDSKTIIKKRCSVKKVIVEDNRVVEVVCLDEKKGEEVELKARLIISNIGISNLVNVLDGYESPEPVNIPKPAIGAGFVFRSPSSILNQSGVVFYPGNERLKGAVEPTRLSPDIDRSGGNILITHQVFLSNNISREIDLAREELFSMYPSLEDDGEEICVHSFSGAWPVNRALQGSDLPVDYLNIDNLQLVGDGHKEDGWIMTEGVAHSVYQSIKNVSKRKVLVKDSDSNL